jgi:predicted metal-binding membrane protein
MRISRAIISIWVFLLVMTVIAWMITVRDARMMGIMRDTMGMSPAAYVSMWSVMMAAMMLPSFTPIAALYDHILGRRSSGLVRILRTSSFVCGYLIIWSALGLIAFACSWLMGILLSRMPEALPWAAVTVFIICGLYQFTSFKDRCLKHCRSPVGFLFHFGNYHGIFRDLRAGLFHGGYCVGCCAGLMLVMIITGVMNLGWMIALAIIIFIEKIWRFGDRFAVAVGYALIVLAVAITWYPNLL